MKINRLKLFNFRPFYKETPWFNFSSGDKNVIVIHCENGIGKTTLLNAFTWAFYEKLTEDLQEPEELTNKRAIREANIGDVIDCWVEIHFEHLYYKYRLKRIKKIKKTSPTQWSEIGNSEVIFQKTDDDGRWRDVSAYSDVIGRILPEQLHSYFFFNGERIDWIQRPINRKEFINAVTLLIGDEIYNRAIRHLKAAKEKLEDERKLIGDAETSELYRQKERIQYELNESNELLEQIERNIEGYEKEQKRISDELFLIGGEVTQLENERILLKEEMTQIQGSQKENRASIVELLSSKGYEMFSGEAVKTFLKIVQDLREKGQIPSPYKATFVKHLLDDETCICGRPLIENEPPYNEVKKWLNRASASEFQEVALKVEGLIEDIGRDIPNQFKSFDNLQASRAGLLERKKECEKRLDEISERITDSEVEKAKELEVELQNIKDSLRDTILKKGEELRNKKDIDKKLKEKEDEIEKREANSERELLLKKQIKACNYCIEETEQRQKVLKNDYRIDLAERINEIFNKISFKPYSAVMSEDYSLSLVSLDGSIGKSTSESQILSLSFIIALMEQAKEFTAKKDLIGLNSSEYPLIMDSPFGNLGKSYQSKVSELVPQLANQLMVLVSPTQWTKHVEGALMPKIGKEYIVTYYTPKPTAGEVSIDIKGISYDLVKRYSGAEEYLEIKEVNRHG